MRGVDAALDALADRAGALAVEADDLAGELRRYGEAVDAAARRLDEVEERLALFEKLKRKHGGTIAAVLAHADACRARRDELAGAEEALEERHGRAGGGARRARGARGASLRAAREAAAAGLAGAVVEAARRSWRWRARASRRGSTPREDYGPSGADEVEFLIAPNPGVPAGPLRDTASGGELSRVMLALMSVAAAAGPATLVFDEVDAGIGGQTARAVGEQLRALAAGRQVICITHLPQIASMADRHFTIVKDTSRRPGAHDGHAARARRGRGGARADARRRRRRRRRPPAREGAAQGGVRRGVAACGRPRLGAAGSSAAGSALRRRRLGVAGPSGAGSASTSTAARRCRTVRGGLGVYVNGGFGERDGVARRSAGELAATWGAYPA